MQSRMKKYYDNIDDIEEVVPSRAQRNKELYREVSNLEIEDFDLNSNVSVIGDNSDNINIDDIKEILTEKYAETKKDRSFGEVSDESIPEISLDETREYDINSLLTKAKENKEVNYEKERLMKLRDTQYNIFKDIEEMQNAVGSKEEGTKKTRPEKMTSENELFDLINTITSKELARETSDDDLDPLDILTDLKGEDENTKVLGALSTEEKDDTLETILNDIDIDDKMDDEDEEESVNDKNDEEVKDEEVVEKLNREDKDEKEIDDKELEEEKIKVTQNFSTNELGDIMNTRTLEIEKGNTTVDDKPLVNTSTFTQSDFDDFNDLKEDMHATKIIIKILIVIIILVFIGGCVLLLNKLLGWGLF